MYKLRELNERIKEAKSKKREDKKPVKVFTLKAIKQD